MAITKSAKKALRQGEKRRIKNLRKKRETKKLFKEIVKLISEKKSTEAKQILPKYYKILDKTAKTGLIKKSTAGRKKSRMSKLINKG
jgi:small subunit ribosomal protein S20